MATFKVKRVESSPIEGQKPGTSGLRKKVYLFPNLFSNDFDFDFRRSVACFGLDYVKQENNQ